MPVFSNTDLRWSWTVWGENDEALRDRASVEPRDEQLDQCALALRERVRAAEEVEGLLRGRGPEVDRDLAVAFAFWGCSLDHHPPAVDCAYQRMRADAGLPARARAAAG